MDNKLESLQELTDAIDRRQDIEFLLNDVHYNISTDGVPFIAVCPDGDGQYYKDAKDLVNNHFINGKPLKNLWQNIEIIFM